ncbi:MAG: transporter substrate-binding domain-containing protein [Acidimicrobiia bacterium]|nr:transporter substrate-binding domain-containing protein [Acidimicrobiia bacterium]
MSLCRIVFALALLVLAVPVAGAASLDEILKAGEIKVGVNPTLPPRTLYNDKYEIDGFEPEVAGMIAKKLGVKLTLVPVGSPDRIPFVATGKIDFVMGAMSRTAERAKVIDYTVPVHSENYGIVTIAGKGSKTLDDFNKDTITLIQVSGTTAIPFIEKRLPRAKVVLFDNYPDRNRALAQGRGDASFDSIDSVLFALKPFPQVKWEIIPVPEFCITYSGLGLAKGNHTLKDWLNVALHELHVSGDIERVWEKWFLVPMATKVPVTPFF